MSGELGKGDGETHKCNASPRFLLYARTTESVVYVKHYPFPLLRPNHASRADKFEDHIRECIG
jgi:hypothetical protein